MQIRRLDGSMTRMGRPSGFEYAVWKDGTLVISHHGRVVTRLRHPRAAQFLDDVELGDPQEVMARWTGNYKHGNERTINRRRR